MFCAGFDVPPGQSGVGVPHPLPTPHHGRPWRETPNREHLGLLVPTDGACGQPRPQPTWRPGVALGSPAGPRGHGRGGGDCGGRDEVCEHFQHFSHYKDGDPMLGPVGVSFGWDPWNFMNEEAEGGTWGPFRGIRVTCHGSWLARDVLGVQCHSDSLPLTTPAFGTRDPWSSRLENGDTSPPAGDSDRV